MTFIKLCQQLSLFTKTIIFRLLVEKLSEQGKITTGLGPITILVMTATMKVWLFCLKHLLKQREILVSDVDDPTDYHTRRVALAETVVDGKGPCSCQCPPFLVG